MQTTCKHCGEELEQGWDQCPSCLKPVSDTSKCSNCGRELKPQWKMCPACKTPTPSAGGIGQPHQTPHPDQYSPFVSNVKSPGQPPGTPSSTPPPGITPAQNRMFTQDIPDIPEGETMLEQFRIKKKIGSGGCGKVYFAENTTVGEDVAIKTIGGFGIADEMLRTFVSEYRAPRDFKNVLSQRNSSATKGKRNTKRERVFLHKDWLWL